MRLGRGLIWVTRVRNHEFGLEILPRLGEQRIAEGTVKISPAAYSPVPLALRTFAKDSSGDENMPKIFCILHFAFQ